VSLRRLRTILFFDIEAFQRFGMAVEGAYDPVLGPHYPTLRLPVWTPATDVDCGEIRHHRFTVLAPDPHRRDGDNDGIG
jgi:hypothetical protein